MWDEECGMSILVNTYELEFRIFELLVLSLNLNLNLSLSLSLSSTNYRKNFAWIFDMNKVGRMAIR